MRILYVTTVGVTMVFFKSFIRTLLDKGHTVDIATNETNLTVPECYREWGCTIHQLTTSRQPFCKDNFRSIQQIKHLVDSQDYDVVHCHTPVASVCTRLACKKLRKKPVRVFYTAHGFHFYRGAPLKNWLVYYPIEKLMAPLCDILITINSEDYQRAKKHFRTNVKLIHGIGVDPKQYQPVDIITKQTLRKEECLSESDFVILCTGELNENKDQKTLLSAAALLKEKIPCLKVLLAGVGPAEESLRKQVHDLRLDTMVRFLGYRTDLQRFVGLSDAVVSCSLREGLGLNIIEGMLCKKPVIAASNRGHRELVRDGENGYLFPPSSPSTLAEKILILYQNPSLTTRLGEAGHINAQNYTTDVVNQELSQMLSL